MTTDRPADGTDRPSTPGARAGGQAPPGAGPVAGSDADTDGDAEEEGSTGEEPDAGHAGEEAQSEDRGAAGPRGGDAGQSGHALAELASGAAPPRPPRRTGVFLDSDDLREHVGDLLRAILGGYEVDAFGNFTFPHEGARVVVTVGASPIGPQVGVFSVTNLDVDLSPELGQFLLTANHTLAFGAFSYDAANRAVWLRYTLNGATLDLPELQSAVAAIATTASQMDDTIRERFGGRTFEEAPDDVQRRVGPPEASQTPPPEATGYL